MFESPLAFAHTFLLVLFEGSDRITSEHLFLRCPLYVRTQNHHQQRNRRHLPVLKLLYVVEIPDTAWTLECLPSVELRTLLFHPLLRCLTHIISRFRQRRRNSSVEPRIISQRCLPMTLRIVWTQHHCWWSHIYWRRSRRNFVSSPDIACSQYSFSRPRVIQRQSSSCVLHNYSSSSAKSSPTLRLMKIYCLRTDLWTTRTAAAKPSPMLQSMRPYA